MKNPRYIGVGIGLIIGVSLQATVLNRPAWHIALTLIAAITIFICYFMVRLVWRDICSQD